MPTDDGEPLPGEVVYRTEINDLFCYVHGHLASERDCDYTRPRDDGHRSSREPIPVRTTITATVPIPDIDQIT